MECWNIGSSNKSQLHLLFAKSQTILYDLFRCVICVCYPPEYLVAAALFSAQLLLKIELKVKNLTAGFRDQLVELHDGKGI